MIKGAVCNDITIDGHNIVLTGSNMSGKSTFLRTIGVNAILAQTFYMAMAKKYQTSFFNVLSSIEISPLLVIKR
jgi:DNA mismatch repair ATPase MutS